ncbi:MAG: rod shape-determining protein MreD [Deltaproteobacteria bacterium]|nr:rod shape-determining protein MreD [Deltaproteobacteria bacterium]
MKLTLLFSAIGIISIVLQMSLLHLLPLGPVVPDLILVLCVYLGLHHPSVGAALGSFVLGYSIDVVSSPLLGINAFAMSLVFLAVYLSARSIWVHSPLVSVVIVLAASLVKSAALVLISALFVSMDGVWETAIKYVLLEALLAAALAPIVFMLLQRSRNLVQQLSNAHE